MFQDNFIFRTFDLFPPISVTGKWVNHFPGFTGRVGTLLKGSSQNQILENQKIELVFTFPHIVN